MTRVWPTRAALVAALALSCCALLPAGPANAVAVSPTTDKSFSASIDAYPTWVRESGCSPTEKPGPKYLRRLLRSTYGDLGSNIVRPCTGADSGHEEGRALDWMTNVRVPEQREMAEAFIAWLQAPDGFGNPEAMARRLGIAYVIWNNYTWRAYDPARGWTEYNRCDHRKKHKKRFDNYCHRTHVHVSFTWDGALRRTSYYSGFVACPAPLPVALPAATSTTVTGEPVDPPTVTPVVDPTTPVTPLTPARVLNTRTGLGTVSGPCRVHPDVRLDLPVVGVGGVPAAGVSAVVLRVQLRRPDADLRELRVWPAGTAMPVEPAVLDATGTVAEVTVPVGAGGQVSLQLTGAMAHVRVYAIGYVPAPA